MNGETYWFLLKELNLEAEVAKITELAMAGQLDFFDSADWKRLHLLKGLEEKRVNGDLVENADQLMEWVAFEADAADDWKDERF